jgi:hypothetical protein
MNYPPLLLNSNPEDASRWERQRFCLFLLDQNYGDGAGGENNIRPQIDSFLGPERAALVPAVDFSNNALLTAAMQLTTPGLYNAAPQVMHQRMDGLDLAAAMESAKYWLWMQRMQFLTVGMGDAILHFSLVNGRLHLREVPCGAVVVEVAPDDPSRLVRFKELRLRDLRKINEALGIQWCWDVYRMDPEPEFYVESVGGVPVRHTNLLGLPADGIRGAAYTWRLKDGTPYIPYNHYAISISGGYWHHNQVRGLARSTVKAMAFATAAGQSAFDSSHSTAVGIDIILPGGPVAATEGAGFGGMPASRVSILPGSLLSVTSEEGKQGSITQLRPSADLSQLRMWMAGEESALLTRLGLAADDVQFTAANPTSAASLAIRNRAKRMVCDRSKPFFRAADAHAFQIAGALLGLPEEGYSFAYQEIPDSPEDQKTQLESEQLELQMKLTSRVILYQRHHPGTSREDAIQALKQIDADEAALSPLPQPMIPTGGANGPA